MAALTREQIKALADTPIEKVEVPEWGGDVYVRTLYAEEQELAFKIVSKVNEDERSLGHADLIALCCCDEQGERLFTGEDVQWLRKKSLGAANRILEKILKLNPFISADREELEKNSLTPQQD